MTSASKGANPVNEVSGTLVLPEAGGKVRLAGGEVMVDGERIALVNAPQQAIAVRIIFPAFCDAHLHLPQFRVIGGHGLPLLDWLDRIVYPAEVRWNETAIARAEARAAAQRLLAAGTTGVAAYATSSSAGAQGAIEELAEAGLRGYVGQVLMDRAAPAELIAPAERQLHEAAELRTVGRVAPIVTPRFAISCTPDLLAGAGRLAQETGWRVQTHLAETAAERARAAELFGGRGYVDIYREAGLLRPGAIFAHAVHVDETDRRTLAAAGAIVAHCPTANAFLGSGRMDLAAMQTAGVTMALGSDIGAGPDVSMVRVARAMAETALSLGNPPPSAEACFWRITRGNADALGLDGAGRLETGAAADLLVIEPDIDWLEAPDPLGALLFGWDDRWIKAVIAQGRVVHGDLPAG
jgi:guanine deaminase